EAGVDRSGHVPHVVAADLPRRIGQAVGVPARRRVQQQARTFDRIARYADDARLLALHIPVLVRVDDRVHLPCGVVLDLQHLRVRPDFELARRLTLRNLGIERRPFGAELAALEAEAGLLAGRAAVARLRIDGHAAGVTVLVAELLGAGLQDLEVVVAGQPRNLVGPRDTHAILGPRVIRFEFLEGDRPVEQGSARDLAIGRAS